MSRTKKTEEKPKETSVNVDVESFVRHRDTVLEGLANLQDCLKGLAATYIQHTNSVLGEHAGDFDAHALMAKFSENFALGVVAPRAASPARSVVEAEGDGKKERKRRQHDPEAPKRPLTPFFLYMQTARPIIANDLGADAAKGAVSTEGTHRWAVMDLDTKALWTAAYKENLRLYQARMHSYKAGNKDAKNMTDAEAAAYAEDINLGELGADAQLVGEASATHLEQDAEGEPEPEPEREPTPPPAPVIKTPKAKGGRKGKATKAAAVAEEPVEEEVVAPTPSSAIVPPKSAEKETPKSPEKKRKRASKKSAVEEAVETPAKEDLAVETPAKTPKPRKKKTKSDA